MSEEEKVQQKPKEESDMQKIINVLQGLTQSVDKLNSDVRKWHKAGKM